MLKHAMILGTVMLAGASAPAPAQDRDESARVPRFLVVASGSSNRFVRLDEDRTPMLRRRMSVSLIDVPLEDALKTIARESGLNIAYSSTTLHLDRVVRLDARDITVAAALTEVLLGTNVDVVFSASSRVMLVKREDVVRQQQHGAVGGRVVDSITRAGVAGVAVAIDGSRISSVSRFDGSYLLREIPAGTHVVKTRKLGYSSESRTIQVRADFTTVVDFVLGKAPLPLDQVVVTGTVVPTELKSVPNAISVVTARDIEDRGITRIDQLFRGWIPGLFAVNQGTGAGVSSIDEMPLDQVVMFSRGATVLQEPGTLVPTTPMKVYLDGVELADPRYLSQIDPSTVERIEILPGPQASTVYGSNAINGVMQIFTKTGLTQRPQVSGTLLSGFVQNNLFGKLTPQHDYSLRVGGREGALSYHAGASWNYVGPWTPAKETGRATISGGARLQRGPVTVDARVRSGLTRSHQRGVSAQVQARRRMTGEYPPLQSTGRFSPQRSTLVGQTLGLTIAYAPFSWWNHELTAGRDASDADLLRTEPRYNSAADTLLFLSETHSTRTTWRYVTSAQFPMSRRLLADVTAGVDSWSSLSSSMNVLTPSLTGNLGGTGIVDPNTGQPVTPFRQPGRNTGTFLRTQIGISESLYLTYGLRLEWNPDFGDAAEPNFAPRYGIAYTRDIGPVMAKLRASYGRSTRPPQSRQKLAEAANLTNVGAAVLDLYGPFDLQRESPELGPEYQEGGEFGLEVFHGNTASLVLTRYNQRVDGLAAAPIVDSVRARRQFDNTGCFSGFDSEGYAYCFTRQFLNVASIRNEGWELRGTFTLGAFTFDGTQSWMKSRVRGVNPKYRELLVGTRYQPGARFSYLPDRTWSANVTYGRRPVSISLRFNGTGDIHTGLDDLQLDLQFARFRHTLPRATLPPGYRPLNPGYATADLSASYRVSSSVDALLHVVNLTDYYRNDYNTQYAVLGRQLKAGVRVRR